MLWAEGGGMLIEAAGLPTTPAKRGPLIKTLLRGVSIQPPLSLYCQAGVFFYRPGLMYIPPAATSTLLVSAHPTLLNNTEVPLIPLCK